MNLNRLLTTTAAVSLLVAPCQAAEQVFLDGATRGVALHDPYRVPQDGIGERHGMVSFAYGTAGQLNDGYVTLYQVQYQSDQTNSSFELRLFNPTTHRGRRCPDILADINIYGWDNIGNTEQDQWNQDDCANVPDPTLYSSGNEMGLRLILTSDANWTYYVYANAYDAVPQDGNEYIVQVFWSTGDGTYAPWVKYIVTKKGGPAGTLTYFDEVFTDGADPGFDVPFEDQFWQFGCQSSNTSYVDTCYRGGLGEFYLNPTETELIPYGSTIGLFVTSSNTMADLGADGSIPFNWPPQVYLAGDDTTFIYNAADQYFRAPAQTYDINGWVNTWNPAVGQVNGGTLYTDWQDPF